MYLNKHQVYKPLTRLPVKMLPAFLLCIIASSLSVFAFGASASQTQGSIDEFLNASHHSQNHLNQNIMLNAPSTGSMKAENVENSLLGYGYSDDNAKILSHQCLSPMKMMVSGGSSSTISMGKAVDYNTILETLGVNLNGRISHDGFTATAAVNFAHQSKSDALSSSYYFYDSIHFPSVEWQPTGVGQNLLNSYGKAVLTQNPILFRAVCGNKYVQSQEMGSNLFATVKISFASAYDKEQFEDKMDLKYKSIAELATDIKNAYQHSSINGQISIIAFQQGGEPAQLAQVFSADSKGGYPASSCNMKNMDQCQKIINGVLHYASKVFPNQFTQDSNHNGIPDKSYPIKVGTQSYTELGIGNTTPSQLVPAVVEARKNLFTAYQTLKNQKEIIGFLVGDGDPSSFPMLLYSKKTQNQLKQDQKNIQSNIDMILAPSNGVSVCFSDLPSCPNAANNLLEGLNKISDTYKTFANAYKITSSSSSSSEYPTSYLVPTGMINVIQKDGSTKKEVTYRFMFPTKGIPPQRFGVIAEKVGDNLVLSSLEPSKYNVTSNLVSKFNYYTGSIKIDEKYGSKYSFNLTKLNMVNADNPYFTDSLAGQCVPINIYSTCAFILDIQPDNETQAHCKNTQSSYILQGHSATMNVYLPADSSLAKIYPRVNGDAATAKPSSIVDHAGHMRCVGSVGSFGCYYDQLPK